MGAKDNRRMIRRNELRLLRYWAAVIFILLIRERRIIPHLFDVRISETDRRTIKEAHF